MASRRWMIWAAIAVAVAGVGYLVSRPAGPQGGVVSGDELASLFAGGARVIDVRTPIEYEGGHIPGAENVPVDQLPGAAGVWDREVPIAVYCLSGERSANAAGYLTAQGFTRVYDLGGGIGSWKGDLVTGAQAGDRPGAIATSGRPRMIEFSSDT